MSYNSKYKGEEVEGLLESIGNKVDKVDGKQLSTEDFTTLLKQKLDGLSNYDDTEISQAVSKLRTDLDALVSGDTTTAIKTFNEVVAFLDGISDTEDLSGIIASIEQQIAAKQDKLVSGTNIKTINGTSILGSGDIVISGGSSSGGSGAYAEVNHGTGDTTFTLTPNTFHVWDEVATLDLSFADEQSGVANEYLFQFTSGATATTLTLPDGLKWANDSAPTIAENMIYQISVLKGLASILGFNNKTELIENLCVGELSGSNVVFTFQHPVASDLTITFLGEMTSTVTINKGETSVIYTGQMLPAFVGIRAITPNEDDSYIYKFSK